LATFAQALLFAAGESSSVMLARQDADNAADHLHAAGMLCCGDERTKLLCLAATLHDALAQSAGLPLAAIDEAEQALDSIIEALTRDGCNER
jgi:hypothetical protein